MKAPRPARTVLIEDGILKGYLQDRLNARLMGMEPTGNGRRESFAHAPMPRMTNTFMLGGQDDPDELITRVKDGIFAKSFGGGQVDITSGKFVFSCTEAYRIEGGKLGAADQGRDADRRRAERAYPGQGHRQRHGARRRCRHLRQGRPVGSGRRWPADPADRRADGRRDCGLSLVELACYGTRVEAELARLALDAEGIEAVIFDAEANSFFGGGGLIAVRLMVLEEDLDEAAEILKADRLP